jgi:carbonic anhydrase
MWQKLKPSRRCFLRKTTVETILAYGSIWSIGSAFPSLVRAQSPLSPDDALKELTDGNRRFAAGRLTSFDHDLTILKQRTVDKQEPFAAVLSCADSRVPVELIFDQSIGHIFVVRVAGNIVTPEIIASIEYGVAVLGIRLILVMGHANCGAVKAALSAKEVPGQISVLYSHLQPAVEQAGQNLEMATKANVGIQAARLRRSSTVVSGLLKEKKLKVIAAYYDLGSGGVTLLE